VGGNAQRKGKEPCTNKSELMGGVEGKHSQSNHLNGETDSQKEQSDGEA